MDVTQNFKLFNKYIPEDNLSEVTSFIAQNTLAFDTTPVFVDHLIQTIESGAFLEDAFHQTEKCDS